MGENSPKNAAVGNSDEKKKYFHVSDSTDALSPPEIVQRHEAAGQNLVSYAETYSVTF